MKIAILVEGSTERALMPHLRGFLKQRLTGQMPKLDAVPCNGRLPKGAKLKRQVELLLKTGKPTADVVIALTDVYTGRSDFRDAADAKAQMRTWVGNNDRFFPHAAQYEFEAWLLPYWSTIQRLSGTSSRPFAADPETVNHNRPPSKRLSELFCRGPRELCEDAGRQRDSARSGPAGGSSRLCGVEGISQHDLVSVRRSTHRVTATETVTSRN
ncbi:MAG: DUF4276 family protein [Planctomycetota bacterium]